MGAESARRGWLDSLAEELDSARQGSLITSSLGPQCLAREGYGDDAHYAIAFPGGDLVVGFVSLRQGRSLLQIASNVRIPFRRWMSLRNRARWTSLCSFWACSLVPRCRQARCTPTGTADKHGRTKARSTPLQSPRR